MVGDYYQVVLGSIWYGMIGGMMWFCRYLDDLGWNKTTHRQDNSPTWILRQFTDIF